LGGGLGRVGRGGENAVSMRIWWRATVDWLKTGIEEMKNFETKLRLVMAAL
jgi:superfamily II DNA helicase RecQ